VPTDLKPATESKVATDSDKSRSACEPYRLFIVAEFGKGRNATAIYKDLVEHHAYDGAYDAVKRFVRTLRKDEPKISCRFETAPGVDYVEYRVMLSISDGAGAGAYSPVISGLGRFT
jgi:hypothetical protein